MSTHSQYQITIMICAVFAITCQVSLSIAESFHPDALYDLSRLKLPCISGVEYTVEREIDTLFAVPEKNAVGTNALDNAITLLKFDNGQLRYDTVKKYYMEEIYGGKMVFMPEFSKDTIGYTQTRGFLLFNIKKKTFKDYIIGKIFQITIDDVFPIDGEKKLFLFQLNHQIGFDNKVKELALIDLSSDEPNVLASYDIEKEPLYAQLGKTTFHFIDHNGNYKLQTLNEKLLPINHPLNSVYNDEKINGEKDLPVVHSTLPFAAFIETRSEPTKNYIVWIATWREKDKPPILHKLFENSLCGKFQFSPDNKVLLFRDSSTRPRSYMVMHIDPHLPYFLGPPVMLQCDEEISVSINENGKTAWIDNPLCFVATFKDKLIKWDISESSIHRKIGH